nr:hypothetical protein [bacterium]
MRPCILKFGGTSVKNTAARRQAARAVQDAIGRGESPVVVVSAIGRAGDPYATDTLLALPAHDGILQPDARGLDELISLGERLSAALFALLLSSMDIPARALSGRRAGIQTDDTFGAAAARQVDSGYLEHMLGQGIVPVVAGFQGATPAGDTTTLGRGGSDTTAVLLGSAMGAPVAVYTDVSGVYTADPRLLPRAKVYSHLSFEEMMRFAGAGARVLHKTAAKVALENRVPLWVGQPASPYGTWIGDVPADPENGLLGLTHRDEGDCCRITAILSSCVDEGAWACRMLQVLKDYVLLDVGFAPCTPWVRVHARDCVPVIGTLGRAFHLEE